MKTKRTLISLLLFLMISHLWAQEPSKQDTAILKNEGIPKRYWNINPRQPVVSFTLSTLLPLGVGQYYNKQYIKGGVITVLEVGSIIGVGQSLNSRSGSDPTAAVCILTFLATQVYAMIDAPISSVAINNKYHLKPQKSFASIQLSPTILDGRSFAANKAVAGFKLTIR